MFLKMEIRYAMALDHFQCFQCVSDFEGHFTTP